MKLNSGSLLIECLIALLICGLILDIFKKTLDVDAIHSNIEKYYEERI